MQALATQILSGIICTHCVQPLVDCCGLRRILDEHIDDLHQLSKGIRFDKARDEEGKLGL